MATSSMHNLTTLIKRLEAATSRLEDIATSVNTLDTTPTANGTPTPSSHAHSTAVVPPTSNVKALPATGSSSTPLAASEELPASIEDYDKLINEDLATFVKLSADIDPVVTEQSKELQAAFEAQREFLFVATLAKKPEDMSAAYMDLIKPTGLKVAAVDDVRTKNRSSTFPSHLAMVADGVQTLTWVTYPSKPADTASELFGGAQMYGNKILREYKGKDEKHVDWVKAFYALQRGLIAYIREHHLKSVQWNPKGVSIEEAMKQRQSKSNGVSSTPPAPSAAGGAPPPPPPPPPGALGRGPPPPPPPPGKAAPAADMGAVFQQLQQGERITSGLKKVDPSQMTHKNPSLRAEAPVPARSNSQGSSKSIPPNTKPKPESMRTKKPPRKELDGNKWIIENFESPSTPVVIEVERNHSILITKCKNTTIQLKGKANAISIDSSPKTSLIIQSLVSSVDVIKCDSFALQVLETLPTVLLDQVDGATIYLAPSSLNTEVFTSKSSNVNVYLPGQTEEDDFRECNVPEQFRSYVKDGKLITEIVEHKG